MGDDDDRGRREGGRGGGRGGGGERESGERVPDSILSYSAR